MCNNHWYIFFRLHHILCERLTKMYNQSLVIRAEETKDRGTRKESTAVALRLKPKSECEVLSRRACRSATVCVIPSEAMFCFVFLQKFLLPIRAAQ